MFIVAILVVALFGLAAYAVLWMTWQTGKVAVNGVKHVFKGEEDPDTLHSSLHTRVARENREYRDRLRARAKAKENQPKRRMFQLECEVTEQEKA